jgi:GR25 family glycosyltransferase involved in LPS biosynthesis
MILNSKDPEQKKQLAKLNTGTHFVNSRDLPVFVINLDSDVKRWNYIEYQLKYINCNKYQRVPAVDMRKPNMSNLYKDERISLYTKFTIQKKHRCDHKQIDRTGAIGATLSHYNVWKKIIDENIDLAIVMEDDMHLMNNYYDMLQLEINKYNKEFDILNIGYFKNYYSDIDNSKFYFGAGCYIITKEACEILCKHVFPIDTHVDAYFFLLNHFGYLKMIMSDINIIFPGGDFNSNIPHGVLKCMDVTDSNITVTSTNKETTINKETSSDKETLIKNKIEIKKETSIKNDSSNDNINLKKTKSSNNNENSINENSINENSTEIERSNENDENNNYNTNIIIVLLFIIVIIIIVIKLYMTNNVK